MMPSANTVAREKPPPANRSYRLKRVPCPALRRKSARACTFTPGVAMCAPARYTSRQMNVTENFSQRSSGSLKTFSHAGKRNDMGDSGLDGAARLLDLLACGSGHGHALHDELPPHVPHAEQFDRVVGPAHQPRAEQRLGRDLDAFREPRQVPHVHDLCRLPERVREAPLGDATDERHLPALEPRAGLTAGASRLALAAPAGRLPDAGARPATLADAAAVRAQRRLQARERDPLYGGLRSFLGPGAPRRSRLRFRLRFRLRLGHRLLPCLRGRHLDEVAYPLQHAAQRRMVRLDDRVLVVLEPQRLQRALLDGGPADPRPPLADAQLALARRGQDRISTGLALAVLPGG